MPTIAIISQKGGAGKTTLALHLAAEAEANKRPALIIDMDQQGTASQWAHWRQDAPPIVIDSLPNRLRDKIEAAKGQVDFIVIDTPPHADSTARAAAEVADLILIPCRPAAFDLAAIQTTAKLAQLVGKPAYVIFTAGSPNAPRMYEEAAEFVRSFGLTPCPHTLPDRATFRHASVGGQTAREIEPNGKAAAEIRQIYEWTCRQVDVSKAKKGAAAA